MPNQELYKKMEEMKSNPLTIQDNEYKKHLSSYYESLLPLREIDEKVEEFILNHYNEDTDHCCFLIQQLSKTTANFKDKNSSRFGFSHIQDISEEELINFIEKSYQSLHHTDQKKILNELKRDISPSNQLKLFDISPYLLKIIQNPTEETILKLATSYCAMDLHKYILDSKFPLTEALQAKIRKIKPEWYIHNRTWNSKTIAFFVNEFEDQKWSELNYKSFDGSKGYQNSFIQKLTESIIERDECLNFELHRLAQTPIGRNFLLDIIKKHQNYKPIASVILTELENSKKENL